MLLQPLTIGMLAPALAHRNRRHALINNIAQAQQEEVGVVAHAHTVLGQLSITRGTKLALSPAVQEIFRVTSIPLLVIQLLTPWMPPTALAH